MSDELSPDETRLTSELARLVDGPDEATRRSIMRAVLKARRGPHPTPFGRRSRFLLALVAAVLVILLSATAALAASSHAVPTSPSYQLRLAGEDIRLMLARPKEGDELRIGFARDRFQQAREIAGSDHVNAKLLLTAGHDYLTQVRSTLRSLSSDEQGQVEGELNQAQDDENNAQNQVDQQGSNNN
jgi:gas vesicle protein